MTTQTNHSAPPAEQPRRRKSGPPPGSRNALRHGLRSGGLPPGCSYLTAILAQFRAAIEDAVIDARGEVTLIDSALISTATRWEQHAMLAGRWLRLECKNLSAADRLNYSRQVAEASEKRDKALSALDLGRAADDLLGRIPVFESKTATPEGPADSSHLGTPETSAAGGAIDETSDPAETPEKFKQVANSRDAGESVSGNCDSGQNEYTREDRGH